MENKAKDILKETSSQPVEGETVSELAHRHLQDENHVTTDEELSNAKLEIYNIEEPVGDLIDTKDKAAKEAEIGTTEGKDIIITPLDVLH